MSINHNASCADANERCFDAARRGFEHVGIPLSDHFRAVDCFLGNLDRDCRGSYRSRVLDPEAGYRKAGPVRSVQQTSRVFLSSRKFGKPRTCHTERPAVAGNSRCLRAVRMLTRYCLQHRVGEVPRSTGYPMCSSCWSRKGAACARCSRINLQFDGFTAKRLSRFA